MLGPLPLFKLVLCVPKGSAPWPKIGNRTEKSKRMSLQSGSVYTKFQHTSKAVGSLGFTCLEGVKWSQRNDKGKFQAGSHPWEKVTPYSIQPWAVWLATMNAIYLGFYTLLLNVYNGLNAQ